MITSFYLKDLTMFEFHRSLTIDTYCSISGFPWSFARKARLIQQLSQKMLLLKSSMCYLLEILASHQSCIGWRFSIRLSAFSLYILYSAHHKLQHNLLLCRWDGVTQRALVWWRHCWPTFIRHNQPSMTQKLQSLTRPLVCVMARHYDCWGR